MVQVAPSAEYVGRGLQGYHLDFPGDALRPDDCVYVNFQERLLSMRRSTVYGRLARDPQHPGALAVQYWFFYVFNDWKNRHEGDWEMIQLEFPTGDVREALEIGPTRAVYSQHAGASSVAWDGEIRMVDATHPVVFPAAGSHASYARPGLYLARGGREGLGCDDARADETLVRPAVQVIPSDPGRALREYPWLGYDGRWGEMQASFFNGPTGPRDKLQWERPFTWSQHRDSIRSASLIPTAGLLTTPATDAFCQIIGAGALATRYGLDSPTLTLLATVTIVMLLMFAASRTRWSPSAPLRLARRRTVGQMITAARRMYLTRPLAFLGVGLIALLAGVGAAALQVIAKAIEDGGGGWGRAIAGTSIIWTANLLPVLAFPVIVAAVARMVQLIDEGERPTPTRVLRDVARQAHLLLIPLAAFVCAQLLIDVSLVLMVLVVFVLVRLSLFPVIVGAERHPGIVRPIRRSIELTRHNTWRTAVIVFGAAGAAVIVGPVIGVLTLILTGWPFAVVNLITAVIHTVTLSYAAIALTYLYADLSGRNEAPDPTDHTSPLPAEFALTPDPRSVNP